MKKLYLPVLLVLSMLLAVSGVFAQTEDTGQMGVSQQDLTGERLEHGTVGHGLTLLLNMMSEISGKVSAMMKKTTPEKMKAMSALMKDLSDEALEISKIMEASKATPADMTQLDKRMLRMQKELSELESAN